VLSIAEAALIALSSTSIPTGSVKGETTITASAVALSFSVASTGMVGGGATAVRLAFLLALAIIKRRREKERVEFWR
jgi:hypothetical protein